MPTPTKTAAGTSTAELALAEAVGSFAYDPLGFVNFAFKWGEKGTVLEHEAGPDVWQRDVLKALGDDLKAGASLVDALEATALKIAVASGHGIGKTALVAWIIHWFACCFEFGQTVVTANTKTQLLTKTWRELAKWNRLSQVTWFEWTATQYKHRKFPDSWFASAVPWSEHASEAFAGTHERFVLVIFDEASLIADKIWEVTEGAMTTANAIWIAFGNPTRNTGRFAECFGRQKHRWRTWQIDSRTAKMANKKQIQQWIDDYGEDSDFVRVRVRGVFPRAGSLQLISLEDVTKAMNRKPTGFEEAARIIGVDIARHGDDQTVLTKRQGVKVWPQEKWRIPDTMQIASRVSAEIAEFDPDAVFIDVTGIGWGVFDRLRQLGHNERLFAVQVGEAAIKDKLYYNKRSEIWAGGIRDFLKAGGCLPDDRELESDLIAPEYGYDARERLQLEKKEDTKERGLASPDCADSLGMTFAAHVEPNPRKRKKETWRDRLRAQQRLGNDVTPQSA